MAAPGLGNFVEALVRKGGAEFNVHIAILFLFLFLYFVVNKINESLFKENFAMEGGSYLTKLSFKFLYGGQVRVFQENGEYMKKSSIQTLSINKQRIKLSKGHTTRAKEEYSSAMQVLFLNLTQ